MRRPDIDQDPPRPIPNSDNSPLWKPKGRPRQAIDFVLPATSFAAASMVALAAPSIVGASDFQSYLKVILLAGGSALVSYGVNKLAVDRGVPLAATGYRGAFLASLLSIAIVGTGLATFSYAGLTMDDVAEKQLEEHGAVLSAYISDTSAAVSLAARINPVIRTIADDLKAKAECEVKVSCISGKGNGGYGTVARVTESYASRAASLLTQIDASDTAREKLLASANGAHAEYQSILADTGKSLDERRIILATIDGRIKQDAGELNETVPLSLLSAYAAELKSGVTIPGNAEAQDRLNSILANHGQSLSSVAAGIEKKTLSPPTLPGRTGVADTLRYIPDFLPIAAIVAVIELIFPVVLWLYAFWALHWEKVQTSIRRGDDDFLELPSSMPPASSAPIPVRRPGRPPSSLRGV